MLLLTALFFLLFFSVLNSSFSTRFVFWIASVHPNIYLSVFILFVSSPIWLSILYLGQQNHD